MGKIGRARSLLFRRSGPCLFPRYDSFPFLDHVESASCQILQGFGPSEGQRISMRSSFVRFAQTEVDAQIAL